ncbi:MAG: hypothetical protein HY775_03290 [Acidobacteria bacterium]|nr:hypothetical protein [Acidobacteriota bacterium]
MFERFTDRAGQVVLHAQEESRLLRHDHIGTEHVLLGLIRETQGIGAKVLASMGATPDRIRSEVLSMVAPGEKGQSGHIPFTRRAKKVMEQSLRQALKLGHNYIGTEHILLGLLAEGEGVAPQALARLGVTYEKAREKVVQALSAGLGEASVAVGQTHAVVARRVAEAIAGKGPACPSCRAPLEENAAYRIMEVPEHEGKGKASTLFVFCRACGATIDTLIAPEES